MYYPSKILGIGISRHVSISSSSYSFVSDLYRVNTELRLFESSGNNELGLANKPFPNFVTCVELCSEWILEFSINIFVLCELFQ